MSKLNKVISITDEIQLCRNILNEYLVLEKHRSDMDDTLERYTNALHELAGLARVKQSNDITLFSVDYSKLLVQVYLDKGTIFSISYSPTEFVLGLSKFARILSKIESKTSKAFRDYVIKNQAEHIESIDIPHNMFNVKKEPGPLPETKEVNGLKSSVALVSVDKDKEQKRLSHSLKGYNMEFPKLCFVEPRVSQFRELKLTFESVCAHHTFPFFGIIQISYSGPEFNEIFLMERINYHVKRFQTQEDITKLIYDDLNKFKLSDLQVRIVSEHTCMTERGVKAHGALTVTKMPFE